MPGSGLDERPRKPSVETSNNTLQPSLKGFSMTKAYWISAYHEIKDSDALAAYAKLAGPALTAVGAKFLARGLPAATKEAGMMQRVVLIEFESVDQALAAYASPGYQEALAALGTNAVVRDMRIIEGV
jgi:uncharacterized protein (DUF1330 family)